MIYNMTVLVRPASASQGDRAEKPFPVRVEAPSELAARRWALEAVWVHGRLVSTFLNVHEEGVQ